MRSQKVSTNPHSLPRWWYTYPSEKYEFVSWDDEFPMDSHSKFHGSSHHQPVADQPSLLRMDFRGSILYIYMYVCIYCIYVIYMYIYISIYNVESRTI